MAQRAKPESKASTRHTISTHVLDIERGLPAAGVSVVLFRRGEDDEFEILAEGETDDDGRIADLVGGTLRRGDYQLLFDLAGYRDDDAFLQGLAVALRVTDDTGTPLPPDTPGRLQALLPGRPDWLDTGHRGHIDRDGFVTLVSSQLCRTQTEKSRQNSGDKRTV